ncbi:AMP-binding protein [Limibaculum sp. M0105]|uniref:3-methylmercaptopropionyl-CoA ligase n=1 Tax=Thermohalobaculum xanthum TaxID=2753746 RepID=A0A8J7M747_9RHOB|nr:AMP-binding protein [Thermohalobaculum xanthum]MBK0398769.1 AMP-binding protein [Thermohalobaculum xanthum]
MNIARWLEASARLAPGAPALLTGTEVLADYAAFARRASGVAAALDARFGIAPGDRVGIFMANRTEYLEALYGILWAGAAAVPINAKLHPAEAAWILDNAQARACVVAADTAGPLAAAAPGLRLIGADTGEWHGMRATEGSATPAPRGDGDLAWLFYTSGTTGRPKGVMITHGNLIAASLCYPIDVDTVAPSDAAFYAAPMSHGQGLYTFVHTRMGARHVVPPSGGVDPDEILDLAPRIDGISMFAAPTIVRRLVQRARERGLTGEGIKTIVYGGAPMYLADIEEAITVMGPRFVQIYGQGEAPMTISALSRAMVADRAHPRWRERLGSVGVAQSCAEIAIADETGHRLPAGETGEILVRGPQVMAGYWRNPEATDRAIRDGWLWTGDVGRLDADGFLTLTDRSKDVIISGGSNIYPREVEEVLLEHADVAEAAVIGRRHPDWGEEVIAFVVPEPGRALDTGALDRHCLERIARFKRPKAYRVVDALPKNNYGKVLKTALRAEVEGEAGSGPAGG